MKAAWMFGLAQKAEREAEREATLVLVRQTAQLVRDALGESYPQFQKNVAALEKAYAFRDLSVELLRETEPVQR